MKLRIPLLTACAVLAGPLHAGAVLETTTRDLSQGTTTRTTTQVENNNIRIETGSRDGFAIFRNDTLYVINTRDKNYVELDRAAVKQMAQTLSPALKLVQQQLEGMSPEQRAQVEQMLGGEIPEMKTPPKQEVRRTERLGKVGQYGCEYVELLENAVVQDEICVAPPAALPGGTEIMAAASRMSQLLQETLKDLDTPWLRQSLDQHLQNYEQLGGIPVATKHYANGKVVNETTLTAIRKQAVPASSFEVPAGYVKRELLSPR
jgi:hypothetical protein